MVLPEIERDELARRLGEPALTVLNVLPREAFEHSRIPGSLSLPVAEVPALAPRLLPDRAAEIVVHCGGFS